MREIRTETTIQARPEKVWQILADFDGHQEWNPFIKSIAGNKMAGAQLTVRLQPPGGRGMTFKPRILIFEPAREFRWLGRLFFNGLFDGEHYFILEDNGDGTTTFIHGEEFTGLLVSLLGGTLNNTRRGFELMNAALKLECEK